MANTFPGRIQPTPHPIQVAGFKEFEVREILDSKIRRRKLLYFVDWVGYDLSDRSWEPAANLSNAQVEVDAFHSKYPDSPRPRNFL